MKKIAADGMTQDSLVTAAGEHSDFHGMYRSTGGNCLAVCGTCTRLHRRHRPGAVTVSASWAGLPSGEMWNGSHPSCVSTSIVHGHWSLQLLDLHGGRLTLRDPGTSDDGEET